MKVLLDASGLGIGTPSVVKSRRKEADGFNVSVLFL